MVHSASRNSPYLTDLRAFAGSGMQGSVGVNRRSILQVTGNMDAINTNTAQCKAIIRTGRQSNDTHFLTGGMAVLEHTSRTSGTW